MLLIRKKKCVQKMNGEQKHPNMIRLEFQKTLESHLDAYLLYGLFYPTLCHNFYSGNGRDDDSFIHSFHGCFV